MPQSRPASADPEVDALLAQADSFLATQPAAPAADPEVDSLLAQADDFLRRTPAPAPAPAPFGSRLRAGVEQAWKTTVDVATQRPAVDALTALVAPGTPPVPAAPAPFNGQRQAGNIELATRPTVQNPDGTVSTVRSISIGTDQGEVVIPTVVNGRVVSDEDAIRHYQQTGQHLGIFDTPETATAFAEQLHQQEAARVGPPPLDRTRNQFVEGALTGASSVVGGIGGAAQAAKDLGYFGKGETWADNPLGASVRTAGRALSSADAAVQSTFQTPEQLAGDIRQRPELLTNPAWWERGAGNVLGSASPYVATLRGASMVAPALLEAMTEGGNTYNDAIAAGKSPQDAAMAAAAVTAANLAIVPGFNKLGTMVPGGKVAQMGVEALQEAAQEVPQNVAAGRPLGEGVANALVLGGLGGATMGDGHQAPRAESANLRRPTPFRRLEAPTPPLEAPAPVAGPGPENAGRRPGVQPAAGVAPPVEAPVDIEKVSAPAPDSRRQAIQREMGGAIADEEVDRLLAEADAMLASDRGEKPAVPVADTRSIAPPAEAYHTPPGERPTDVATTPDTAPRGASDTSPEPSRTITGVSDTHAMPDSADAPEPADTPDTRDRRQAIRRNRELVGPEADAQERFARAIEADTDGFVARYREKFGNVIDADKVKELSGEDLETQHRAVHAPSSWLADHLFDRTVAELPDPDVVAFTAGGPGAGKSSLTTTPRVRELLGAAAVQRDSPFANVERARQMVAHAKAHGHTPVGVYVYTDPVEAYRRQAGRKRTVDVDYHLTAHRGALETVQAMAPKFGENLVVLDNSGPEPVVLEGRPMDILARLAQNYPSDDTLRAQIAAAGPAPGAPAASGRPGAGSEAEGGPRGGRPSESPRARSRDDGTLADPLAAPRGRGIKGAEPAPAAAVPPPPPSTRPSPIALAAQPASRRSTAAQVRAHAPEMWGDDAQALPATSDTEGSPTRRLYTEQPAPPRDVRVPRTPVSEASVVRELRSLFGHERPQSIIRSVLGKSAPTAPIPVGTGRVGPRAFGLYKIKPQVIRLKRFGDLATFTHELGHDLDFRVLAGTRPAGGAIDAELHALGKATSPASATRAYQRNEGVAEFFRVWFANPDAARTAAPQFAAAFDQVLSRDKALARQFEQGRVLVQGYLAQPLEQRARARIDFTGKTPNADPTSTLQQLETAMVDDLAALRRTVGALAADQPIDIAQSAYVLARLARGAGAKASGFLGHGIRDEAGQFAGPSFKAAIAPVIDNLEDFSVYLVARRAQELRQRNIEPGMRVAEVEAVIGRYDSPAFRQAADAVYAFQAGVMDYAVSAGAITADQAVQMRALNQAYVPFWRILDKEGGASRGKGIADQTNPFKRIKGSGRDLVDPIEAIIRNTHSVVHMVEQHRAMLALVTQTQATKGGGQFLEEIKGPQTATRFNLAQIREDVEAALGEDLTGADLDRLVTVFTPATMVRGNDRVISVMHEGARKFYEVHDPALYEAIVSIGPKATGQIVRWLGAPARGLRAGATLTVGFMARNPVRDAWVAAVQSRAGFRPGYDSLRGLFSFLKADEHYQLYLNSGAGQAALVSGDRNAIRRELRELKKKGTLREHLSTVVVHPIDTLRALSEAGEMMTRLGEFRRAREKGAGLEEAALNARDVTVDFARKGTVSGQVNQFAAFFNARVQGYARFAETFRENPTAASIRVGASVTMLSLILWALNKDDDEYQELPDWEKNTYWHVPTGQKDVPWVRIPKPFELGALFGTVFERAMDQVTQRDPHAWKRLFVDDPTMDASAIPMAAGKAAAWSAFMAVMPTGLLPVIEARANYSTFRDRAIVSPYDVDLPPELQYNRWTSETAKAIGGGMGLSPAIIDHLVAGYGAGLARGIVSGVDEGIKMGRGAGVAPAASLDRVPGVGVFAKRYAGGDAASIKELYARRDALRSVPQTVKRFTAEGKADKASAYADRYPNRLAEQRRINRAAEALTDYRTEISSVYASQTMTPQAKRDRLDRIDEAMVNTARVALGKPRLPSRFSRPG